MTVQPAHHLSGSHHHLASGSVGLDMLSIGWQMATAHALSAGLTVLVWSVMAGALQEIFELPDQPSLAVGERRVRLVSDVDRVVRWRWPVGVRVLPGGGRRGHLRRRAPDRFVTAGRRSGVRTHPVDELEGPFMKMRNAARLLAVPAAAGLITLGLAGPASAHVTVTPENTAAGSFTVVTMSVPHGCDGSPTTKVAIQIPKDILAVTPTRNPYYDVAKKIEKLPEPVTDATATR